MWILFCLLVRKEYVNAFRKALEGREIDLDELRIDISEASTVNALIASLASTNERQVVYALDLLTSVKDVGLIEPVQRLLKHRSAEVRRQAVRVLETRGDGVLESKIEELLKDDDQQVRLETMLFLCRHPKGNHIDRIKGYLEDPDLKIQAAAIGCIAEYGLSEERHLIDEKVIQSFLCRKGKEGELGREQMAKALGRLDNPSFRRYLFKLMEDPSPRVVRQAIESSGRTRDQEFVALLIEKLSDKRYRVNARMALAAFGSRILDTLNDYLRDETVDVSVSLRGNIARVLSEIPAQKSVDILIEGMKSADPTLKYHLIKALNKLRARYQQLRFDQSKVDATLIQETKSYYEILQIQDVYRETQDGTASKLLKQVLIEKQEQSLERIFRLLGLRYPPKDMYSAYQGIVSSKQAVHASAIEFLDTMLNKDIKKYLFPFLDQVSLEITIQKGQDLFRERIKSKEEALVHLIRGRDAWLRACAIYNVVGTASPTLMRLAEEARNDLDPAVRETAKTVLQQG